MAAGVAALAAGLGLFASTATAHSCEDLLAQGAAATEQNYLNVPFAKPENWKTPYGNPDYWSTSCPSCDTAS